MSTRPPFAQIKSYQEFSQYYWYREELIEICRNLGIPSTGMKTELNRTIEAYFNGETIKEKHKIKYTKPTVTNISL